MRNRAIVALLIASAAVLSGCRSAESVRQLPLDLGVRARYAVPSDTMVAAVPGAMGEHGDATPRVSQAQPLPNGTSNPTSAPPATILLGSTGSTLLGYGAHTRVVVQEADEEGHTDLRALSRSQGLLDISGRSERLAPRLLKELDERLGSGSIVPYEGMRMRGRTDEDRTIVGIVLRGEDGGWLVTGGPDGYPERVDALSDLEVSRGSYSRRWEWALGLGILGWVVGLALPPDDCTSVFLEGPCKTFSRLSRANLGLGIGTLGGFLVGSLHRTEVWSEMAPVPGPRSGVR